MGSFADFYKEENAKIARQKIFVIVEGIWEYGI